MSEFIRFDCGCKFPILSRDGNFPRIDFCPKIETINLECKKTWDLIGSGNTKGVFQLESRLGRTIAKKLKPDNMEELSALISILRPGALEAVRDGKSVTNHYIDKKHGLESVDYFHPSLEPSLQTTLGEMIYQEQAMQIAKDIAGFDLKEADDLRKAIGKKQADKMAEMREKFIKGCKQLQIVTEHEAEQIFGWIEKGQRYSFNKCVDPNAVVDTPDGLKTLDEIQKGDYVLAPADTNIDEYVEVVSVVDCGPKEVYEITTEMGETLVCTLDHKILCEDGQMRPLYEILYHNHKIMVYSH